MSCKLFYSKIGLQRYFAGIKTAGEALFFGLKCSKSEIVEKLIFVFKRAEFCSETMHSYEIITMPYTSVSTSIG